MSWLPKSMRMKPSSVWMLATLFALAAVTVWIRFYGIDIELARWLRGDSGNWRFAQNPALRFIYNAGVLPTIVVAFASLVALLGGLGSKVLAKYRKISGYFLLCLLVGPGIITNFILKNNWGRPRPSQLAEFGGEFAFEPVMWMNFSSDGKSFPCGHATMGFFFFAVALVLPAAWKWRRAGMIMFAALLGGALGFARMAQGGHFLSDVIWSGAIIWFVSLGMFRVMRMQEKRYFVPGENFKSAPAWVTWACLPLLVIAIVAGALGTPYENREEICNLGDFSHPISEIYLDTEAALITRQGDELLIMSDSEGFGFPNSKLKYDVTEEGGQGHIRTRRKGYFTVLHSILTVTLPKDGSVKIILTGRQAPANKAAVKIDE